MKRETVSDDIPFVSIIILNYNGKNLIQECLKSVFNTDYKRFEVIVVDNASGDNSLSAIQEFFGKKENLKLLALDKNYGYSRGNNLGFTHINPKSKYVVFLNNDTVVARDWLKALVRVMEEDESVGAAMPRILNMDAPHENCVTGFIDVFGGVALPTQGDMKVLTRCFFASGCAAMVRKDVINRVGLFNPNFFAYYEDTDLSWRIQLHGYSVVVVPDAVIVHKGGATSSKASAYLISFETGKNKLYAFVLNYCLKNLFKYGFWLIFSYFLDIGTNLILYTVRKNKRYLEAGIGQITGIFYIITNIRRIWKERMQVQHRLRKVKDDCLIGRYILVPKPFLPGNLTVVLRRLGLLKTCE